MLAFSDNSKFRGRVAYYTYVGEPKSPGHYGLKYFPLLNPSQKAPKFNSLVEQCRTKIQIQLEAGHGWEGFHVKICLQKSEEIE